MAQELINYGRKYDLISSSAIDFKSSQHTECKTTVSRVRIQKAMSSPGKEDELTQGKNTRKKKYPVECGPTKRDPKNPNRWPTHK